MDAPTDEYAAWRDEVHARMPRTDETLLAGAVRAATARTPIGWERIVGGEINEVYAATIDGGEQVIVRVSRQAVTRFAAERWALDAARRVGVPCPEMLHLDHLEDAAGPFWICVENRLPGVQLHTMDDATARERVAAHAGELIARLHSVAIDGFGWLRPDGTSGQPTWGDVMRSQQDDAQLAVVEQRGATFGVPAGWVRAASAELHRYDDLFAAIDSRLLHGDLSSDHVLADAGTVSGFIDFEQAFAGDPAFEFVRWNYFREDSPLEWLLAGYRRVADPGPDLELRIRLGRLRLHLAVTDIYVAREHGTALPIILRRFAEDAEWFGFS